MSSGSHSHLKNYKKTEVTYNGQASWRLAGHYGPVDGYKLFCDEMIDDGMPFNTRRTYASAVAQFLDYCYEAGVFEQTTTKREVNDAVKSYRHYLAQGEMSTKRIVSDLAKVLPHKLPKAKSSIGVSLAGVKRFLELSDDLATEQAELLSLNHGIDVSIDYNPIVNAMSCLRDVSENERREIRNTLMGGVIRNAAKGFTKAVKSLATNINPSNTPLDVRWEFPLESIGLLIEEANLYRDKTMYCLLAGGGVRISEVLNVRWGHIDFEKKRVYVRDPRCERDLNTEEDRKKFKGRNISRVFMYQPFKDMFFYYLDKYINSNEFVATEKHDYIFQITKGNNKGGAIAIDGDESTQWKNFTNTVKRLNIRPKPDGRLWSPHSLRHAYGVWMLNYIPHEDGVGFPLAVVTRLMGHKNSSTTDSYARDDIDSIDEKLEYFDRIVIANSHTAHDLQKIKAERLLRQIKELLPEKEARKLLEAA